MPLLAALLVGCLDDGGADAPAPDAATHAGDAAPPLDAAPEDAEAPDAAPRPPLGDQPRFGFPIHPDDRALMSPVLMFGFDHGPGGDRTVCTAYDGDPFPACYGGHEGSDFVLLGGFRQMDTRSARVVAAAGGEVIRAEDGHYDRCRGDLRTLDVTCDGHPMRANQVTIRHANGWRSRYLHFQRDSIVVREGDWVDCGRLLALVGSSGYSTMPHLHFEVLDPDGRSVDPFAETGADSLWREQETGDVRPANGCDPAWGPAGE